MIHSEPSVSASATVPQEQLDSLERQLAAAKAEAANTKNELCDLQDRYTVTTTTNTQIKEQLMKELNEKKVLQERLDLKTEEAAQKVDAEADNHRQQLEQFQHQLEIESQARKKQEDASDALRRELQALELAKREADASLGQLESDKRQVESNAAKPNEMAKRTIELETEVKGLQTEVKNLEQELSATRSDKKALAKDKTTAETELDNIRHKMEELQRHLSNYKRLSKESEKLKQNWGS
ncbi:hypothetical protein BBJ29_005887 [Phytophthora kernoviae]|uniref:Uncharacterized protein n=1 Tax=Phytophthora kernoviae TaxID=325452 RepID=A0A3R7HA35_9STRA|nr:hypothetical protein BBJ29_005887 [Phytophthora kernoviae]